MLNPFFRRIDHESGLLALALVLIQGVVTPSKQLTLLLAFLTERQLSDQFQTSTYKILAYVHSANSYLTLHGKMPFNYQS